MNKIALAPTSLPSSPPMEYVTAAAGAGYEAIGLRVFRSPGITYPFYPVVDDPAVARDVKKAIADSGMEVVDVLSFYMQEVTDLDSFKAPLEFGKEIGATYALVIGDDPDWNRMVDNFGRFADLTGSLGMITAIEAPVVSRQVNKLDKAVKLIKDCGRSNAVVCLDPFQFARVKDTPEMIRASDPRLYPYTQMTDGYIDPAQGGRCALGEGAAPLYGILDALMPEVPLSLEWPAPRDSNYTPAEWAKNALEGCKAYLNGYYASKK
ncbi:MAG TPA: TIM barrel protein [Dehalococcoidia bacterium]|nr:TIM barrel protein [Dehalococcoidia bacterium]